MVKISVSFSLPRSAPFAVLFFIFFIYFLLFSKTTDYQIYILLL